MDLCHYVLVISVIIFIVSLIIFFKRIGEHAINGNGFYDYNKETTWHQRAMYDAGTDKRAWIDKSQNETGKTCPPAYC